MAEGRPAMEGRWRERARGGEVDDAGRWRRGRRCGRRRRPASAVTGGARARWRAGARGRVLAGENGEDGDAGWRRRRPERRRRRRGTVASQAETAAGVPGEVEGRAGEETCVDFGRSPT